MSLRSAFRVLSNADFEAPIRTDAIASPWTTGTLETLVWADLFDLTAFPVDRGEALSVPAVARARFLIAGTIARVPLTSLTGDVADVTQPSWCSRTDGLSSPFHRMLWTLDDLVFYGESLWAGPLGTDGFPLTLDRVPYHDWDVDTDGRILVDPRFAGMHQVYIPGPHEGILAFGAKTIRQASVLDKTALDNAQHPFRVELHQITDAVMDPAAISGLVASARRALYENGGVMFTNSAVEAKLHTFDAGELLVEGRNQAAVDCARMCGLPASLLDANTAGSSLTYETADGRNRQFLDYCLATYMTAVSSRLGMDDVVPRGHRIAFDTEDLVGLAPAATGPTTED